MTFKFNSLAVNKALVVLWLRVDLDSDRPWIQDKDSLARNNDNVSELSEMPTHGLLLERANTMTMTMNSACRSSTMPTSSLSHRI